MFFLLSKLLAFLITPVIWIVVLLGYSIYTKDLIRRKKALTGAFALLLLFSNAFILDEVMRFWEIPAVKREEVQVHEIGIVLGGMLHYDAENDRIQFSRGVDRLLQAIDLYRDGKIKKLLFTGGSGSITYASVKEGPLIKRSLLKLGVAEEDVIIESESKNTRENALFTKTVLDSLQHSEECLLFTSAFHMRRSLACFQKTGIHVQPYSVDRYSGPRKLVFDHLFLPSSETMAQWNILMHELVGYCMYKLMGYV